MTQSSSDCSPGRLIRWMNTTADQPLFTAVIATTNCHYQSKGDFLTWNEFLYYPETNMTITAAKQQSPSNVIHSPSYFPLSLQQSLVNIKWTSNWQKLFFGDCCSAAWRLGSSRWKIACAVMCGTFTVGRARIPYPPLWVVRLSVDEWQRRRRSTSAEISVSHTQENNSQYRLECEIWR